MPPPGLTIGQAAKNAGITRKAVRVYEARGLLPAAEWTEAGSRLYDQHDIRDVLAIRNGSTTPCATVGCLLDARIAESTPPSPSC